jgi:hypothetical protein
VPSEGFVRRFFRRSRPYWLPLLALEFAVGCLLSWHLALRRSLNETTERLAGYSSLDSGARAIQAVAEQTLTHAIFLLIAAMFGAFVLIVALASLGWSVRCVRGAARFRAATNVRLETNGQVRTATLIDISRRGCRVSLAQEPAAGAEACLTIGPIGPQRARIVWSRNGMAGLVFARPLETSVLDAILEVGGSVSVHGRQVQHDGDAAPG